MSIIKIRKSSQSVPYVCLFELLLEYITLTTKYIICVFYLSTTRIHIIFIVTCSIISFSYKNMLQLRGVWTRVNASDTLCDIFRKADHRFIPENRRNHDDIQRRLTPHLHYILMTWVHVTYNWMTNARLWFYYTKTLETATKGETIIMKMCPRDREFIRFPFIVGMLMNEPLRGVWWCVQLTTWMYFRENLLSWSCKLVQIREEELKHVPPVVTWWTIIRPCCEDWTGMRMTSHIDLWETATIMLLLGTPGYPWVQLPFIRERKIREGVGKFTFCEHNNTPLTAVTESCIVSPTKNEHQ